jgi:hypothetical protein
MLSCPLKYLFLTGNSAFSRNCVHIFTFSGTSILVKMKCIFSLDGSGLGIPEFEIKKLYQDQDYREVCNVIVTY